MRFLALILFTVAVNLGLAAGPAAPIPVVVTANTILDDLVRQVGGDQVSTHCLVAPGSDPHTFEPRPADVKLLLAADLLVVNGLDLEPAVLKLAENCGFHGAVLVATTGLQPRTGGCTHDHEHTSPSDLPATHSSLLATSADPHAWQDPRNVAVYIANIRDALVRANPAATAGYRARATAYLAELTELDSWAREQIATIPAARRKLVTSHDSLGYFAAAYGFEPVPVSGLSTATEANARDVAAVINLIRREQVPAVFFEVTSNPKLVRQIGADAGVRLAEPLFTDSLGAPGSDTATYLAAMRTNVSRIVAALRP